jgi:hypothetical protein
MENNAVREESMERCEGLENWLTCARCSYICTNKCPLEGSDVVQRLAHQMKDTGQEHEKKNSKNS